MKSTILLVDDDLTLAGILRDFFEENGFYVLTADNGASGIKTYKCEKTDIVLLDLDMPVLNGFEVVEKIRQEDYTTPIILMTGSWLTEKDKIRGYELGVVQFLEKPVSTSVLLAQIRSLLNPPLIERKLVHAGRVFRLGNQVLTVDDKTIRFREREAMVLATLMEHPGAIISRKKLLTMIWSDDDNRNNKSLDNIIYQIKKKIAEYPEINIKNMYSKGYVLMLE